MCAGGKGAAGSSGNAISGAPTIAPLPPPQQGDHDAAANDNKDYRDLSNRIETSVDPGTWNPMEEDMVSTDLIKFHSEEKFYKNCMDSYKKKDRIN
ncbi:hypothetical protein Ahy_B06g082212 [Arachis hypogaea]|uniref:Uncharacterized protein n=1 Tax=Arachis hypogaea TaxID=3818 RepID=A0A444YNA3_ARAHY|nr:hypothetical protein Ahy_B06g082212 [Arachis hypogaea]